MTILEVLEGRGWTRLQYIAQHIRKTRYDTELRLEYFVQQNKVEQFKTGKYSNFYKLKDMTVSEKCDSYIAIFGLELAKKCVGQIILNCDLNKKGYFCAVLDELESR